MLLGSSYQLLIFTCNLCVSTGGCWVGTLTTPMFIIGHWLGKETSIGASCFHLITAQQKTKLLSPEGSLYFLVSSRNISSHAACTSRSGTMTLCPEMTFWVSVVSTAPVFRSENIKFKICGLFWSIQFYVFIFLAFALDGSGWGAFLKTRRVLPLYYFKRRIQL